MDGAGRGKKGGRSKFGIGGTQASRPKIFSHLFIHEHKQRRPGKRTNNVERGREKQWILNKNTPNVESREERTVQKRRTSSGNMTGA